MYNSGKMWAIFLQIRAKVGQIRAKTRARPFFFLLVIIIIIFCLM